MKSKLKKIIPIVLCLIFSVSLVSCGDSPASGAEVEGTEWAELKEEGNPNGFKDFVTWDLNGHEVTNSVFRDHDLTMVNVWGTYCPPCLEEMPDLGEIYREQKSERFNILGLVIDVQDDELVPDEDKVIGAKSIMEETKATYTTMLLSENLSKTLHEGFKIDSIPMTFFVDSSGNVIKAYSGAKTKEEWEYIIKSLQ